ncbi:MAG: hypothetical protein H0V53_04590 [Rubrobacter sp.]|nr:hypothetical protein [Rubrobacter sp.]
MTLIGAVGFFLIFFVGVVFFHGLMMYAFYLREREPERYTGIWESLGDLGGNPRRAVSSALMMSGGAAAGIAAFYLISTALSLP